MSDAVVRVEYRGAVGVLRLDRPPVNAIDRRLHHDLLAAAQEVAAGPARAVVLWGGDRAFAAGADIREMADLDPRAIREFGLTLHAAIEAIAALPVPVIAAVTGFALGAGCELALTADLRIIAENAVIGLPEITLGVIPGAGGTQRLARLLGASRAKELILTGRPVRGAEAVAIGLATEMVPAEQVFDRALELATRLAAGPTAALVAAKSAIDRGLDLDLAAGLALEGEKFAALFATADQKIGMASFLRDGPGKGGLHRPVTAPPRQGHPFTLDDVRFLRSESGLENLAAAAGLPLTAGSLLGDLGRLRRTAGERAAAVLETARLRRRGVEKFGAAAGSWLLTETALQQGTPAAVARLRAERLAAAGVSVHDLTCSVGADLATLATALRVCVGSDLDPVRVAMAHHNLIETGIAARVFVGDAVTRTSRGLLGYADPARRDATGRRRLGPSDLVPSVADLDRAHAARPPVLRMPPGIDYLELRRPGEVEIVSLDGDVREAVLWPAELAGPARRASVLRGRTLAESFTSDDAVEDDCGPADEYLVDPDGAVVRAGLVTAYAARHGLRRIDPHLAYLSGPAVPQGVRGFRVLDSAPLREATVAGWIRRDRVGAVEILQRGTPVVPDELRRRLRPALRGGRTTEQASLVIARIGDSPIAYWCRAERGGAPPAAGR